MKISVTGSFASGKSVFSKILSGGEVHIVSADDEGRKMLNENIDEIFSYLNLKNEKDAVGVLKAAFLRDEKIFIRYNSWMYERLPAAVISLCRKHENVILDAALVYEWGIEREFDINILVTDGTFEERIKRAEKQGRSPDKNLYALLEKHQMKDDERRVFADIVIENRGDENEFYERAEELRRQIFGNNS